MCFVKCKIDSLGNCNLSIIVLFSLTVILSCGDFMCPVEEEIIINPDIINKLQKLVCETSDSDLFKDISAVISLICPNTIFTINEYQKTGHIIIKYVSGYDKYSKALLPVLGRSPSGFKLRAIETTDGSDNFAKGQLSVYTGDFYSLCRGKVSRAVCDKIERLIGIKKIYMLNLVNNKKKFGSITFFCRGEELLYKKEIIEETGKIISGLFELKKINSALVEENLKFDHIFNKSGLAIALYKKNKYVHVNDGYAQLFGFTPEELTGRSVTELVASDCKDMVARIMLKRFKGEKTLDKYEAVCLKKDGSEIEIMVNSSGFEINGEFFCFAFVQDITERNKLNNALAESEENLFEIINASPDPICIKDPQGKWILANSAKLSLMGLEGVNYVSKNDEELSTESNLLKKVYKNQIEYDRQAWNSGKLLQTEEAFFMENEQGKIYDVIRIPQFNHNKEEKSLITWGRDITERINAEEELKKYRNHLEDLVEERASELIKTIESLSQEVTNRKKIEKIIQTQNEIANELISSNSLLVAINRTLSGISRIGDSLNVCLVEMENKIKQLDSYCYPEDKIFVKDKKLCTNKIKSLLDNKKNPIYNIEGSELNNIFNFDTTGMASSLLPVFYKEKPIAVLFVISGKDEKLSENQVKAINNITLQLESTISQFISRSEIIESENRWKTLYKNLPGCTIVFNKNLVIQDVNDLFCKLSGYELSEIVGKKLSKICLNVSKNSYIDVIKDEFNNIESEIITKSGKLVPVVKSIREIKLEDEIYYLENFQNISVLKSLQNRLSKINETFVNFSYDSIENINSLTALVGELFNGATALYNCIEDNLISAIGTWNTPEDYLMVDEARGHICFDVIVEKKDTCLIRNLHTTKYYKTDCNVKKYELKTYFGKTVYRNKEIVGTLCVVFQTDFIPTVDDTKIIGIIAGAIGTEEERRQINEELAEYRIKLEEKVRERTKEVSSAQKRIKTEIKKNKETEALLKETEKEYQRLFENSHDAQILIRFETREIIKVNNTACKLFNFKKNNSEKLTLRDIFGPKSEALFYYETYKHSGNKVNFEVNTNNEFFVDINASIIESSEKIILVSCRDITETKLAQKQLFESRRRYEELVQNANDIIIRFDKQGRILYVNPITEKNLGYMQDELIGENVLDFIDPDHKQNSGKFYLNQYKKRIPNTYYELPILKKDGSVVWLGQNVQLISENNKVTGFQAVARNITKQKNAEFAMAESEKRFRTIAESINTVAIYGIGIDKKIIFWNSACENLYGYSGGEALGEEITKLLYHKKNIFRFEKEFKAILENPEKPLESEKELIRKDKNGISVLSNRVLLKTSFGGTEIYYLDIDLTKRKETEKQLQHAKKLAEDANKAKSSFLTNISHELRTPLNGILGYAQSLKEDPELNLGQFEAVEIIEKSGNHLLSLIEDILDLSKIETKKLKLSLEEFNFIHFIQSIAGAMKIVAENKGLKFDFIMNGSIPEKIEADEKYLGQILYNLLGNAVKFTKFGSVKFKIESTNKKLKFTITDTGIGIPEKQMDEIFSPFMQGVVGTMKNKGTGLGLTISKRLVRMMGGNLKVKSTVDKGSEFSFEIKVQGSDKSFFDMPLERKKITGYNSKKKMSILIVDDDYNNRAMLRKLLSPLGFITAEAENGGETVKMYNNRKYDLILLDLLMPDKNGFEVAKEIIEINSKAKIIVVTASSSEKSKEKAFTAGCSAFLSKPVKFDLLFDAIEENLNLTWITEKENSKGYKTEKFEMEIPDMEILKKITNFAKNGEITKLNKMITGLQIENKYSNFLAQILIYIKEFQINEITNFVNGLTEEK